MSDIRRKRTRKVWCGGVAIGGGAPISIQSMTNTDTRDVASTVRQVRELVEAGAEIVRIAVPNMEAAASFAEIRAELDRSEAGRRAPLVADIHFDYRLALAAIRGGADKVRINPGNIGGADRLRQVADAAAERGIPIRVGVNSGSLEENILRKYGGVTAEGLCESALEKVRLLEDMDFEDIVVSIKSSDVLLNYEAHRLISERTSYPLHIGLTEAGASRKGELKSAIGIAPLLLEGIGDTMRISLTGDPKREIELAREILEALEIRKSGIRFVSCPTCGRTRVDLEKIASQIETALLPAAEARKRTELPDLTLAVMGCAVNGPGEAREADIGVACGDGKGLIFSKGEILRTVEEADIAATIIELAEKMNERQ